MLRTLLILSLITACGGTSRTKYQKMKKNQGYAERLADGGLRIVNFKGNAYTKKGDAELFAKFRAIEICHEDGLKYAHLLDLRDKTVSKEVLRTTGTGFPSYYYGMSPYYGRFHSGISIGYSTTHSTTYQETYQLPEIEVAFECVNEAYGPEIAVREVPAKEMKILVKDLKGGLQAEKVIDGSVNEKAIEAGDVIIRVNGVRVEKALQFFAPFTGGPKTVSVELFREGLKRKARLRSQNVSEFVEKAQKEIIARACTKEEIEERKICKSSGGK